MVDQVFSMCCCAGQQLSGPGQEGGQQASSPTRRVMHLSGAVVRQAVGSGAGRSASWGGSGQEQLQLRRRTTDSSLQGGEVGAPAVRLRLRRTLDSDTYVAHTGGTMEERSPTPSPDRLRTSHTLLLRGATSSQVCMWGGGGGGEEAKVGALQG